MESLNQVLRCLTAQNESSRIEQQQYKGNSLPYSTMLPIKPDDELLITLGKRIKSIRILKRMSQTNLALNCDMEKSTLSKIEAGKVNISYITMHRLCKCLEISIKNFHE